MAKVSVTQMTEHLKTNQFLIEIEVAKRKFRFRTYSNSLGIVLMCVVTAIIMRPFPANTKPVVL